MVVEINEMKCIRGITCRCQSVKLFDQADFSCDLSKGNSQIKLSLKLKHSHAVPKNPTFGQKYYQLIS